ncbi:Auxilin-related protein, partial [Thalictrum thalictroides]
TPAETGSPSEVSSEDPVCSDSNQVFSNMQPHYAYDGVKQFNVSYHKTNQIRKEDGISGTTHIAQLDAIPAYTFVVDENLPFQTAKYDNPIPEVANAHNLNANVTDWRIDGEHFWETTPTLPACSTVSCTDESDQQPQKNPDRNGTYNEKPFITVSEISLRTHPSEVPPPSRPPPKLTIKHVSHKVMTSDLKPSANYARQGAERDGSPPFFDVEVDSSSSAAASAAAMKEAMEKAQATLKSAKELMERKKDSLQHRKKFGMKEDFKGKDRRESDIACDSISNKEEKSHRKFEREDCDLKGLDREERQKTMEVPQVAPTVEVKPRSFNVSKGSVVHRQEHRVAQESQREEVIGEWKAEEQFYELVKKDTAGAVPGHKKSERKSIPTTRAHEHEQNEKKAETVAFVKQLKNDENSQAAEMACELEEDDKRVNVVEEAHDKAATDQKIKAAQKSCDHEEHEKRQKELLDLEESEKRLKQVRDREEYEKKIKETLEQEKKEASEREEYERRLKEAHERREHEKKLKEGREREENEKKKKEALQREENERRQRETLEREENKKKQEACEREENERRQKEAREKEENERRINEKKKEEAYQRAENERRHKEACEREESEKRLEELSVREENERKLKQDAVDNERRLKEVHEQEKNETIQKEENEKRLKELYEGEESERKLKKDATDNEMRLNAVHEQEKNEKIQTEARDHKEIENKRREHFEEKPGEIILHKESLEPVDNEKKLRESRELIECEMKPDECSKQETIDKELERESEQEGVKKTHREAVEMEGNDKCGLSQDLYVRNEEIAECERTVKTGNDACNQDEYKNSEASCGTCQREQNSKKLEVAQESCRNGEIRKAMETTQYNIEQTESVKSFKENEVLNEQDKNERLRDAHMSLSHSEHTGSEDSQLAAPKAKVEDSEKSGQTAFRQVKDEKCRKEDLFPLDGKGRKRGNQPSQMVGHCLEDEMKTEVVHPRSEEEKITKPKLADESNTNHDKDRKEKNLNGSVAREGRVKEREQEKERLRKLEEDIQRERDREREREKDRMAVERVTREVRERAYAEARERAERAALERATAEARQRDMAEARERLEKACAEARERSLTEKAYKEARLRAERAAVERATAEARERAVEKAMAEKAAMEARERVERSVSEKFSTTSRDSGLRHTASFSDLRDTQFQSASSFNISQRYPNSSNPGALASEKSQGSEVESAQRCKARLERHQRTVERAAKALAEKNLRDHLAQREQAERNRLAETLDADVKRWSSGKAGNLRALLSTLQYILGPDSGWQPIPLTEVITAVAVKKAYRKATLCVHPDKLQQRGASIQQKYICEKVFDLLKVGC